MYNDADVEAYAARLRSADSAARALAADEATDGVSDWGRHSYTAPQADRITRALVDALVVGPHILRCLVVKLEQRIGCIGDRLFDRRHNSGPR